MAFIEQLRDEYNRRRHRDDVEWIIGASGSLVLRTIPEVVGQRLKDERRRFDDEGRKALHRINHPIDVAR